MIIPATLRHISCLAIVTRVGWATKEVCSTKEDRRSAAEAHGDDAHDALEEAFAILQTRHSQLRTMPSKNERKLRTYPLAQASKNPPASINSVYLMSEEFYQDGSDYTIFQGEFHTGLYTRGPPSERVRNPACTKFYSIPGFHADQMVDDNVSRLFRPRGEVTGSVPMSPSEAPTLRRMLTYEDVAVPIDFHEPVGYDGWCSQFAVRTAQRPVKSMSATSASGKRLMMPAVWKSASTSLTSLLHDAQNTTSFLGPHDENASWCGASNVFRQCEKHTTFLEDASSDSPLVTAVAVRNPLERFLASVYEHGEWQMCDGDVCTDSVEHAQKLAADLAQDFPHRQRSCEHPSQSYFLSATDSTGHSFAWDMVMRIENNFDEALQELSVLSGVALPKRTPEENTSGDKALKQKYFDAIFADLATLCAVCKIYEQDFACLGYAKPAHCTREECASVGVNLWSPDSQENIMFTKAD
eukprot:gnl/TRDRNA2_/TRDRNA2_85817_c0_seq1.p1 gnl/TRDRNA2_/TRDRNA2_85817_c0~~gnl/TRDRNA2_/TRDRNA2_85817_c0_seq1.p1  ORF type:complete len:469 (-),score=55.38 gnl/TRDRNA2_/TRDRNA2_85817_c0_seq1:56-1462(-)